MKRILIQVFSTLILFVPLTLLAQPQTYTIDPAHSYVLWHINHLGYSTYSGKLNVSGTLIYDETKPQNSKVNVTINTAKMITGDSELDKHLQAESFFDSTKFPSATFVSNKITMTGKQTAKVDGTLTLRGISKPVSLNVTLNKNEMNPISNKITAGFSADTTVKRSDFGMTLFLPALSDEVKLDIEAEAAKAN